MKKVCAKTWIFLIIAALLFLATLFCVPTFEVASADSTVTVVKATVGNLKDNAYAGKSAVMIYDDDIPFYIPESYYVQDVTKLGPSDFYSVIYCGETYYIKSGFVIETISVADGESLSPDVRLTLKSNDGIVLNYQTVTNDYTIKLLGYSEDGSEVYASATLNGNTVRGFIPTELLEPFNVPYQQRAQAERDAILAAERTPIISSDGSITPNTSVALRIILIVGITIPALIIVILLFKPSKDERRMSKRSVRRERGGNDIDYDEPRSYRRNDRRYDDDYDRRDYDRRDRDYDRGYDRDYDRDSRRDRDYDDRSRSRDYDDRNYDDRDYRR